MSQIITIKIILSSMSQIITIKVILSTTFVFINPEPTQSFLKILKKKDRHFRCIDLQTNTFRRQKQTRLT